MFENAVANKKTTLGGIAFIVYAIALVFGDLSSGGGFSSIEWTDLIQPISAALAGFGLISAKDA